MTYVPYNMGVSIPVAEGIHRRKLNHQKNEPVFEWDTVCSIEWLWPVFNQ